MKDAGRTTQETRKNKRELRCIPITSRVSCVVSLKKKSSSFNLNFAQQSFGFTHYIGLVTGLGINWNNYRFDNNNNIRKGDNGVIEELNPLAALDKSKLTTVYMTVPLMLEFHAPANHHHLNIGAGIYS